MMRTVFGVTLALGLLVCAAQTATASGAVIQTTAPLSDGSDESVKVAMASAIDRAVRGASAMGFSWVQLQDARIAEHEVVVEILATDDDPDQDVTPGPDADKPADKPNENPAGEPAPSGAPSSRVPI